MSKKTFLEKVIDAVNKSGFMTIEIRDIESEPKVYTIEPEYQEKTKSTSNWPRKPGDPVLIIDEVTSVSLDDLSWQARVKDITLGAGSEETDRDVTVSGIFDNGVPVALTLTSLAQNPTPKGLVIFEDSSTVDEKALQSVVDYLKANDFELFEDTQPGLYPVPVAFRPIHGVAERVNSTDIPSSDASIKKQLEKPVLGDDPKP